MKSVIQEITAKFNESLYDSAWYGVAINCNYKKPKILKISKLHHNLFNNINVNIVTNIRASIENGKYNT